MRAKIKNMGTCAVTIVVRVPVRRKIIGYEDNEDSFGNKIPKYQYKLIPSKLKRLTKKEVIDAFDNDSDIGSTFVSITEND